MPRANRGLKLVLTVLVTTAVLGAGAREAPARGTLDQSLDVGTQVDYAIGNYGGDESIEAQTFTAGLSGALDTVALPLSTAGGHGRYLVDVQALTDAGTPNGTVLARTSVDTCRIASGPLWRDVVFPAPTAVTAGDRYAVVVGRDPVDVLGSTNGTWPASDEAYTGGAHFWKNVSAAQPVWTQESHQLAFQTYVSATAPVPSPRDATEVQLTASTDPAQTDHAVTYTATVIDPAHPGSKPTGTVAFYRDGSAASGQTLDSNGKATYTTAFNSPGTHPVAAAYCPDTDAFESSEVALSQTVVDHFVSATALTVAPDPTVAGQDATFTATVSAVGPASEEPRALFSSVSQTARR